MFAQSQIPSLNQRMDSSMKQSVFQRSEKSPFFGQNTSSQSNKLESAFGNKSSNTFQQKSIFYNQQNNNNNNNHQASAMFGQQRDNNQNHMFPNQRGRGRGRGNAFNASTRGKKTWGQSNQTAFNHFQQSQQQAQEPSKPAAFQFQQQSAPLQQHQQPARAKRQNQHQNQTIQQQPTSEQSNSSQVTAAERAKRFGSTDKSDLYNQLKKMRVQERQRAIEDGLLPDPANPTSLNNAIVFRGTCTVKCPDFEIAERDYQNLLEPFEKDQEGNVDQNKCVKAYRRSAAGVEQPLPSDVRTPEALLSTLDYLVDETLSENSLEQCHAFIRDRTRSIRQDFTLQNLRDITAVAAHERIARFHILCLHEMCEVNQFSMQQEVEQLNKVLLSLMEFYDDLREEGVESENEAEFRAYHLLSHLRDQDIVRQAQILPIHIFRHPYMTRALELHALAQRNNEIMETSSRRNKPENIEASQNNYSKLFKMIADSKTSFLMACMMECHFADIRKGALKAMNTSYMLKAGGVQAEHVRRVLAYDTLRQLLEELTLYGVSVDMSLGEPTICFGQKHYKTKLSVFREPLSNPAQTRSLTLVEPKKSGRSFREIINGNDALQTNGMMPAFSHSIVPANASPFNSWMSASTPTPSRKDESFQQSADQRQRQLELETIRSRAAAAEAQIAREKKKMEAVQERKRQEEAEKQALKLQEQEKILKEQQEQQRKQLEIENLKNEILKREKQEKVRQEQERLKREQEEKQRQLQTVERLRKETEAAEAAQREKIRLEKLNKLLQKLHRQRTLKTKQLIKQKFLPCVHRVRQRIEKRNQDALERRRMWHFNLCVGTQNPYSSLSIAQLRPLHSTPEEIKKRVQQCIMAEKCALESVKKPLEDRQNSIWKTEDFARNIYPRIQDKMAQHNQTQEWQLLVHVAESALASSTWFSMKFGFDDEFHRRQNRFQAFTITTRMVTPDFELPSKWVEETGAIIFSLPESKSNKTPQEITSYWSENKQRLDKLTSDLKKYNPGKQVPILFTYFPDSTNTESSLEKIPTYLGLASNTSISDYHFLFMNPLTISTRIIDEVNWLSTHSL